MRRKGFTLIELLVVIAIIALLASILMPTLKKAQELANRAKCIGHLKNLAPGLKMYSDIYSSMPWVASTNAWTTATGTGRTAAFTANTPASVTALPWLLVSTNNGAPEMFVCPSDKTAKVETNARNTANNTYYWDFSGKDAADSKFTTSYSWQAPVVDPNCNTRYINGVDDDQSMVPIMSDKNPLSTWGGPLAGTPAWTTSLSVADTQKWNSQNHTSGEITQYMTSSYSAARSSRPDCGQNSDFIFGASGLDTGGSQTVNTDAVASHKSTADSYLIGPK